MRRLLTLLASVAPAAALYAQPALLEPPDFPGRSPGPTAAYAGGGCYLLATGTISPGDVDWVQVSIPWAGTQTVVDVDFPAGTSGSALLAAVAGGSSSLNVSDGNNTRDALCGLGGSTVPVGSPRDSAVDLGATARNAVVNIGVTGAEDTGFAGRHGQSFVYNVWVFVNYVPCRSDGDCDDDVQCTDDFCDVPSGICSNTPDDSACDNGLFCDGPETCDPGEGCVSGRDPDCDDGVDCTLDSCDAETGECVHEPDDDFCGDGVFCNGAETCDPAEDCQESTPPCEECDEESQSCGSGRVGLDIKPGVCPNRVYLQGSSYLPAAIVGSRDFDVSQVDVSSVRLSRTDGVGGEVGGGGKGRGLKFAVADVAAAFDGEPCECHDLTSDGVADLHLWFDAEEVRTKLRLASFTGSTLELQVAGRLRDGSAFAVTDCIQLHKVKAK